MAVVRTNLATLLTADADSHVLAIGGDPVGERHVWWNLVSSSAERIEQAKADWKGGRFPQVPGGNEVELFTDNPAVDWRRSSEVLR